jgi:G:T-mismatch repair DNA endonuclease (very short patch repair protein)
MLGVVYAGLIQVALHDLPVLQGKADQLTDDIFIAGITCAVFVHFCFLTAFQPIAAANKAVRYNYVYPVIRYHANY